MLFKYTSICQHCWCVRNAIYQSASIEVVANWRPGRPDPYPHSGDSEHAATLGEDGNGLQKLIMNGPRSRAARSGGSSKKRDFVLVCCVFVLYFSY